MPFFVVHWRGSIFTLWGPMKRILVTWSDTPACQDQNIHSFTLTPCWEDFQICHHLILFTVETLHRYGTQRRNNLMLIGLNHVTLALSSCDRAVYAYCKCLPFQSELTHLFNRRLFVASIAFTHQADLIYLYEKRKSCCSLCEPKRSL